MSQAAYRVAVVGATGAVGTVMLRKLVERDFPASEIVAFASERSAGRELEGFGTVQPLTDETIQGFDIAIFSAGGATSGEWAPRFVEAGAIVIDNSSKWRTNPDVPLVVAEVNPEALDAHQGIIANPNCSTMQLMVALKPIHDRAGIERLIVSTYQSVSGTGVKAVEELKAQTRAALDGRPLPEPAVYPHPIAFNVLGGAGNFPQGDDHTDEERKMMFETRKILGDPDIPVSVTCARVPVTYSHSLSVNVQTRDPLEPDEARELLRAMPGCEVVDDPAHHGYPTAAAAAGRDEVFVGRIRRDPSHPRALNLWVVSDNLYKGAATNAVQLAEVLHERGLVRSAAAAR
ncbi:MAG: aspartate-semialdehyde dehydrogenase [Solirubrobacteraceae bacterium]|nr:aspartate-semialdehyde dehydrogenase [Solirubrobacteraceae bacterium]